MHKLEQIKEEVIEKIESTYKDHSNLEPAVLDYLDKLAHFGKNLGKLCESNDEGLSMRSYRDGMSGAMRPVVFDGRSYDGSSNRSYDGSYDGSYDASNRRNAKRDSMGRYSSAEYSRGRWDSKVEELMKEAPDEETKQMLRQMMGK